MPTKYLCRLIVAAPVAGAKHTTVATFLNGNLSIVPVVPADLGAGLAAVADATNTVVYRWCNLQLTEADAKIVLVKLCQLAAVAVPTAAQWDNATRAQKLAWWNSVRQSVFTNFGVWCQMAANDGNWDDPQSVLTLRGWKTA